MSEQQMEKMREEFESEMRNLGMFERICGECPMDVNKETGEYVSADTGAMWAGFVIGWKASRAALCENHSPDAAKMVAPEGWQLVPVEPTIEMVQAATHSAVCFGTTAAYQAMLAAAPKLGGE